MSKSISTLSPHTEVQQGPTALPRLLTARQTAEYLNLSYATLANQRSMGTGLPYLRIGGRVLYRESDVLELLRRSTVEPVGAA